MAKTQIEMSAHCLTCNKVTAWYVHDGWAFHTTAKHWRCSVCRCVTQPHLFLPPGLVEKIQEQAAARHKLRKKKPAQDDDIVIDL